jgi:hypothetical protein
MVRARLFSLLLIGALLALLMHVPSPVHAQSREDDALRSYLDSLGRLESAERLSELFLSGEEIVHPDHGFWMRHVIRQAALNGLTPAIVAHLRKRGVRLDQLITFSRERHRERLFGLDALFSDLVIVGQVTRTDSAHHLGDDYRTSVFVDVLATLKGVAPRHTIVVRQRGGVSHDGKLIVDYPHDPTLNPGEPYLLFLSNARYRFEIRQPRQRKSGAPFMDPSVTLLEPYFLGNGVQTAGRFAIPVTGDFPDISSSDERWDRDKMATIIEEIRLIDQAFEAAH